LFIVVIQKWGTVGPLYKCNRYRVQRRWVVAWVSLDTTVLRAGAAAAAK